MGNTNNKQYYTEISFIQNDDYYHKDFNYSSGVGISKALYTILQGYSSVSSENNSVIISTYYENTDRLLREHTRYFSLLSNLYLFGWEGYKGDIDNIFGNKGVDLNEIERVLDDICLTHFNTRNYPISNISFKTYPI